MNQQQAAQISPTTEMVYIEGPEMQSYVGEPLALRPVQYRRMNTAIQRAAQVGVPIEYSFSAPYFEGQLCFPGPQRDWYFMPLRSDPLLQGKDGVPFPRRVIKKLRLLQDAQVEVDDWFIAHEAVASKVGTGQQATLEMLTPPPSQEAQQISAKLAHWTTTFFRAATLPMIRSGSRVNGGGGHWFRRQCSGDAGSGAVRGGCV